MYFVDREKIERNLQYMEHQLHLMDSRDKWETELEKAAFERLAHTIIESILDVGNAIIDGFIMRDPGSYEDIIDILTDEKVITQEMSKVIMKTVSYRKVLVQDYAAVNSSELVESFRRFREVLLLFPNKVRLYLTNELGPVSAFKNND
ncbi:DUF86 domain-containing protein [Heyndrickxia acidicola]|uniref:DUF86 domain-containing protein n=1 Tax=Heyndrickxia acidicola TaxID=209389 RepID=A0ABU6MMI7_9BACI|nr:DUF86 domain-containing protein [Heyndrickxia acidicola]MED1205900.1 DUF86 domain-containing protein [Heyndrickxia acidicola]